MTAFRLPSRASALALALLVAAPALPAQQPALSSTETSLLKAVDEHYNHLHSLRTHFSETYSGLGLQKSEQGTLLLSKPGRMRWTYTNPPGKLFVLDGKFAWSFSPGDAQAQRLPAKQLDDLRSPLRLLLGHAQLARELTRIAIQAEPGGSVISGIPRGQEARLKSLAIHVDPTGAIHQLRLEELDGSVTEFQFSDMVANPPTTPADFTFTPPPGIPVQDGLPPI